MWRLEPDHATLAKIVEFALPDGHYLGKTVIGQPAVYGPDGDQHELVEEWHRGVKRWVPVLASGGEKHYLRPIAVEAGSGLTA
jgi:hypothetical protein